MSTQSPGTEMRQETTLRDFLNVVFKRKWIILSVVGLATFLVYFLDARRPNLYQSSSKVMIRRGEQTNVFTGYVRYLGWEEEVSSHIEVILSQAVFERAEALFADSVRTKGYPESWVFNRGAVRADVIGESNAFYISYVDLVPNVCRLGCEVMTLAFRDYYREKKAPPALADFFASELTDVRSDLDNWRGRRQRFMNSSKFYGTRETSTFLLSRISVLENQLVSLRSDISEQEIQVRTLEELRKKDAEELERDLTLVSTRDALQSSSLQRIKFSLQSLHMEKEELVQKYTDKHPEVMAVDEQIRSLQSNLQHEVNTAYRGARIKLEGLEARRDEVRHDLVAARAELDAIPDKERELAEIDAMIAKLEKKHELLLNRQSESEIAMAGQPDWEVEILSHASPPSNRERSDYIRLLLGPFLAVIVALGIAFFLESMDHSIGSGAEVEEFLGVPVLTTVSEMKPDGKQAP